MSKFPEKVAVMLAHGILFFTSLPDYLLFYGGSFFPRFFQVRILRRVVRSNTSAGWLERAAVSSVTDWTERIPQPSDYRDYTDAIDSVRRGGKRVLTNEPVILLQPTSGSSGPSKFIPYTASLRREYRRAVAPWLTGLYLRHPSLFLGRHFWSVSPGTPVEGMEHSAVPVGFADDAEYLAPSQADAARRVFAVPPVLGTAYHGKEFFYRLLLLLVRERDLRLVSVWHPTFFTLMLDELKTRYHTITDDIRHGTIAGIAGRKENTVPELQALHQADPRRADELDAIDISLESGMAKIWPKLKVISCWTDARAEETADYLKRGFPKVHLQPKGLMATEGAVSIPLGRRDQRVAAVRSHFLEFMKVDGGGIRRLWELEVGGRYTVLITTGGGLYRYRLHDIVEVTGMWHRLPCFRFLGRDGTLCDLVGEKLSDLYVGSVFETMNNVLLPFPFRMLAPYREGNKCSYVLYLQRNGNRDTDYGSLASRCETLLSENYHYRHARRQLQLDSLKVFEIHGDARRCFIHHMERQGRRRGDVKFPSLSTDSGWHTVFDGGFVK